MPKLRPGLKPLVPIDIRIPAEVMEFYEQAAKANFENRSVLIRRVLVAYWKEHKDD